MNSFNYNSSIFLPSHDTNNHTSSSSASMMNNNISMDISGTYVCNRASNTATMNTNNNNCGCAECYNTAAAAAVAAISPSSDYSIGQTSCSSTTFAPSLKNAFSYGSSSINTNTNQHHPQTHQPHIIHHTTNPLMMNIDHNNKQNMRFLKNNSCNVPSVIISGDPYFADIYSTAARTHAQKKNHIPLFVRLPPFPDFAEHRRFPKFPKFPKFRRQITHVNCAAATTAKAKKILLKNTTSIFNYGLKESQLRPNGMMQNNIPCPLRFNSQQQQRSKPVSVSVVNENNNSSSSNGGSSSSGNISSSSSGNTSNISNTCEGCVIHTHKNARFPAVPVSMMCKTSPAAALPVTLSPSVPFTLPLPLPPILQSQSNGNVQQSNREMSVAEQFCPSFFGDNRVFPQFSNGQNRNVLSQFSHTTTNNLIHHNNLLYIRRVSGGDRSDDNTDIEKPYACMICYRAFKRKHNMLIHQRVHTSEAFLCPFCEKPFARKSNLKQHLRVHTGERPFKCRSCSKAFTQSHSLKDHCKIHNINESEKALVMDGSGM